MEVCQNRAVWIVPPGFSKKAAPSRRFGAVDKKEFGGYNKNAKGAVDRRLARL